MNLQVLGEDAGRLLALGLNRRHSPAHDPQYDKLLKAYRTDASFRQLTRAVAEGLGLRVLDASARGLLLGAEDESPFALRLSDYRSGLSVEERLVHGLIQLAIAAWCFPRALDLEDDDNALVDVSVGRVVTYLQELAGELEQRATADPDAAQPELREAWRAVLARPSTRATPDGRRTAGSLHGMVAYALERLTKAGLMREVSDADGGTWKTRAAYRIQVREMSAHDAFERVRSAGEGMS